MTMELNKLPQSRLSQAQELKLSKQQLNFSVGHLLKAVVTAIVSDNELVIAINGQRINAKTAHKFMPGQLLEVKVVANQPETILEVYKASDPSLLQNALRSALPRQAPATNLLFMLHQVQQAGTMPAALSQQINNMLSAIPSATQLAYYLPQAINQSGLFLEAALAQWRQGQNAAFLKADFKGQCFSLLQQLPVQKTYSPSYPNITATIQHDPLPLPGAIPQPLHPAGMINLGDLSLATIQQIIREQTEQVIARITAQQITHLSQEPHQGYVFMLDLPITMNNRFEVIPLLIEHHKAELRRASHWSVSFALHLTELGGLQGKVTLCGQALELSINTEIAKTMDLLKKHQHELEHLFDDAGLSLKKICIKLGLEQNHIDTTHLNLVDIRV